MGYMTDSRISGVYSGEIAINIPQFETATEYVIVCGGFLAVEPHEWTDRQHYIYDRGTGKMREKR